MGPEALRRFGPFAVCGFVFRALLVAPLVFRAPEGPAAREARRPHFVRRRASKPARALRSLRCLPHQWGRVAVNSPTRPCHRPRAPQPGPPVPPAPSTPARLVAVCCSAWPRRHPRAPQPGPVGQVARWFETVIAFARLYLCGIETAIAFAGEKRVFLVQFSGAEVMPVSAALCWG